MGNCAQYYPEKLLYARNWSELGYIKCNTCGFLVKTDDLQCKCCHTKFRKRVRNRQQTKNYYEKVTKPQIEQEKDIVIVWKQNRHNKK